MISHKDFGVGITGLGKYIPRKLVTNDDLAKRLHLTSEEILRRTGIERRYHVADGENASWISAEAAKSALRQAHLTPDKIDLIIGCTTSGDYVFPAMACKIQNRLKAKKAGAFDLSASAASFPVALSLAADRFLSNPSIRHILVVGTAVQSPLINWKDPNLAVLLGGGAGAAVVSRVPHPFGVLAEEIFCDGDLYDAARLRTAFIEMDGIAMGRQFLRQQRVIIQNVLKKAKLPLRGVDCFIFHQANLRLIQLLMSRMKLPLAKTFINISSVGNTAEASVPVALHDACHQGRIKRGDIIVLAGVGAGCIISAIVLRWY